MPKPRLRQAALLAFSAVAGVLSRAPVSIISPEVGIRSGLFAVLLSLGLLLSNWVNHEELGLDPPPHRYVSVAVGAFMGLIAGCLLTILPQFHWQYLQQGTEKAGLPPLIYGLRLIVLCAAYGSALNLAYALRWSFPRRRIAWTLLLAVIAGYLCGHLQGWFDEVVWQKWWLWNMHAYVPAHAKYVSPLLSGVPFAIFWVLTAISFDPAWNSERWKRLFPAEAQPAPPQTE